MNSITLSIITGLITVVHLAAAPAINRGNAQAAFADALASIPASGPGTEPAFEELAPAARTLAQRLGPADTSFLEATVVTNASQARGRLAALALATGSAQPGATEALQRLALQPTNHVRRAALLAASFLPPEQIRGLADRLVRQASSGDQRAAFVELLATVADDPTRTTLLRLRETDSNSRVQAAVEGALVTLEHDLALSAGPRRASGQQETLAWWRAQQQVPPLRSAELAVESQAARLHQRGTRFSLPFLRHRLQQGDPLAAAVVALQREVGAIDDLKPLAAKAGSLGNLARAALRELNTPETRRALESSLRPDRSEVSRHVAAQLAQCGDEATLQLLTRLGDDANYPAEARTAFKNAAASLRERLNLPPR